MLTVLFAMVTLIGVGQPGEHEWKPAAGPLMTRWAADVDPRRVLPEYPRPQMVRERWLNLNGVWEFAPAKGGQEPPIGRALERSILVPFAVESALSGVMEHHDRLWYRRTFDVPADWREGRVLLHFGAVDWQTDVWVNGEHVGAHRGGYDPFTLDITGALTEGGPQEVIVGVFDPTDTAEQPRGKQVLKPGGIFYTPTTGIWGTVWLEPVPGASIASLDVRTDVAAGAVDVLVSGHGEARGLRTQVEVMENGREVGRAEGAAGERVRVTIPRARLWSPEDPHLYDLRVVFKDDSGRPVDSVTSYFGMRDLSVRPDEAGVTRIHLNGKPYFQVGLLDQGFWPDGLYTAPTDEALRFDIEETKRLGFNLIRKHVKVEPARWYYWCDRLGVLVWQDMPSGAPYIGPKDADLERKPETAAQFEAELAAMISSLRNHPSIVMWVVFNEGWGQYDTPRIVELAQTLDPTRLVSNASGWTDRGVGDVIDWHVYPGPGSPNPEPSRAAVLGEFGGLGLPVEGHTWEQKAWGYQGVRDSQELTDRYVALMHRVWELHSDPGLSAAVYTQTTDVETECNGLLTYDRAVLKADAAEVAAANRGSFAEMRHLLPIASEGRSLWRFTFQPPPEDWTAPEFDDSSWLEGKGGFGTEGTPGAVIGTEWKTPEIWARRTFELPADLPRDVRLLVHHDEDVEIYINGVPAAAAGGYTTSYEPMRLSPGARAALRPGFNTLAVRCRQTSGGQYIDVGLVGMIREADQPTPP